MSAPVEEEYEALLQFMYMAPIGLVQTLADGEITMVNPLCAQLLMPLSPDGQLSNLFTALEAVVPDLRQRVREFTQMHGTICDAQQVPISTGQTGRRQHQVLSLTLLKLDAERLMAVLSDVTQSVRRERELRQSQAWINTLAIGLSDYALVSLDHRGCVQDWNPSISRITGFNREQVEGRSLSLFYPADAMSDQRVLDRLHEADLTGWSLDEGWCLRADGGRYWGSCLIAPLHDSDGDPSDEHAYSLIIRDVSDRREAAEAMLKAVSCDHLTGLFNRRAFVEAVELEMQRWARSPRPLSLVMIDADHFKRINDQYGHVTGDGVLRHLAASMTATFRAMDVLARFGGEEFIVLLPDTSLEGAELVAQRLCCLIEATPAVVGEHTVRYTVSAGAAIMDADATDFDVLVQRADEALYAAKAKGRNRVERWHPATQPAALP
ncbi:sensor domain-containing diguanylate cyclase [Methyloversatilis sp.]|uniref:sensor domain-containing diguanylate cyclase n=1 Tax=Methyloversatilis sp. TaxID=2569862 RepID=UPI0027339E0D|nr:sensor domain-containing diguanylate cyclase [Methyloversatilis sp.]MDP3455087.1 diguanylate cyclase [Methyloversatilis sp.]MDP3577268.1 diguanylate cyclase [Methyloversatilis sp.]